MKHRSITLNIALVFGLLMSSCGGPGADTTVHEPADAHEAHDDHGYAEEVHLSMQQFKDLDMQVGQFTEGSVSTYVDAVGNLTVPPQNKASLSPVLGGNITRIMVIEGDKVHKGQVLAYMSHPDILQLQSDYTASHQRYEYLEQEYKRQQKLFEKQVGSGSELHELKASYLSAKGQASSLKAQLHLLHLSPEKIAQGEIQEQVPLKSPIDGYIRKIDAQIGAYALPDKSLFDIVNNDHVHVDLRVFEKDAHLIKEGQLVEFKLQSHPEQVMHARIISVGKAFEEAPKSIHLHADILDKQGVLIPGMYIEGRIEVQRHAALTLPEEAVIQDGEHYYVFSAEQAQEGDRMEWHFAPRSVKLISLSDGLAELQLLDPEDQKLPLALNNAYYLLAELKKGEVEHHH